MCMSIPGDVMTVAALPLNRELGSGWVGSILDVGFSSRAAPTFYCCPGILHVSQVLGFSETCILGPRVLRNTEPRSLGLRSDSVGVGVQSRK